MNTSPISPPASPSFWFGLNYPTKLPPGWTLFSFPNEWARARDPDGRWYVLTKTTAYLIVPLPNNRFMLEDKNTPHSTVDLTSTLNIDQLRAAIYRVDPHISALRIMPTTFWRDLSFDTLEIAATIQALLDVGISLPPDHPIHTSGPSTQLVTILDA